MTDRTCTIDGCDSPLVARGWCRKHYSRWHKHGDPLHVAPWSPPPQNLPRTIGCKVNGCEEKHHAKGFCHSHYTRDDYYRNHSARRAQQAQYRDQHRAENRARTAEWRMANPQRVRELNREYREAHKAELIEKRREYREANRDKIRALNNGRKALQRGVAINDLTAQQWSDIVEVFDRRCAYCAHKPDQITMDHVIPLSRGGAHTAANVVPACQPCNSAKGIRIDVPFHPHFEHLE